MGNLYSYTTIIAKHYHTMYNYNTIIKQELSFDYIQWTHFATQSMLTFRLLCQKQVTMHCMDSWLHILISTSSEWAIHA